jgi:hypothetical protein
VLGRFIQEQLPDSVQRIGQGVARPDLQRQGGVRQRA